jgi:hypothetical protein
MPDRIDKHIVPVEDDQRDEELTLLMMKKHHVANKNVVARDGAEAREYVLGGSSPRNARNFGSSARELRRAPGQHDGTSTCSILG